MTTQILRRIEASPHFKDLVRKRSRLGWLLTFLMLIIYYAFILVIAFDPQLLGTPLAEGAVTTYGIPVGLAIIIVAIALTGIYVWRANNEFDRLVATVLKEAQE
jgi:uncharacterized membrane protein (DUF485 family)